MRCRSTLAAAHSAVGLGSYIDNYIGLKGRAHSPPSPPSEASPPTGSLLSLFPLTLLSINATGTLLLRTTSNHCFHACSENYTLCLLRHPGAGPFIGDAYMAPWHHTGVSDSQTILADHVMLALCVNYTSSTWASVLTFIYHGAQCVSWSIYFFGYAQWFANNW